VINVKTYGAVGDGTTTETVALNAAISACASAGGGVVVVPPGKYLTGTIILKTGVELLIEHEATIVGSPNICDYSTKGVEMFLDGVGENRGRALIYAADSSNIAISGNGIINGGGEAFPKDSVGFKERPFLLRLVRCSNVHLSGIKLRSPAAWTSHFFDCQTVTVSKIDIYSHANLNNDGIDIDSCRGFIISDCFIDTGDDAICLKSTLDKDCSEVSVSNCVIRSECSALKIGTESFGNIRNVIFSNCVVKKAMNGGLKILSVDGAIIENIMVSNIIMDNTAGPILVRLGSRLRTYYLGQKAKETGVIRNIRINNVIANVSENDRCHACVCVSGVPLHRIENIDFSNIRLYLPGRTDNAPAPLKNHDVPEKINAYPTFNMFGSLPSSAFYLRHVDQMRIRDVDIGYSEKDTRPAITAEDIGQLVLDNVDFPNWMDQDSRLVCRDSCQVNTTDHAKL
jgi:polygalacturonase